MNFINKTTKIILLCAFVFALFSIKPINAQEYKEPFRGYVYLQPNFGLYQYLGDLNIDNYYNKTMSFGYGGALGWQFSRILGIRGQFNMGDMKSEREKWVTGDVKLLSKLMTGSGQLTLNVNEIFNYNPKRFLTLYLMGGAGYISTKSTLSDAKTDKAIAGNENIEKSGIYYPVGGGLNFRLSNVVNLNLEYNHGLMFNDDILDNSINKNNKEANDQYSYTSIGVQFNFRGGKDTDGDGVKDKDDLCPDAPGLKQFQGCPDTDGDGIPDKDDKCPNVAGLAQFQGCPDTDGDGIADKEDECPNVAGLKELKGCPDADGDGVADHLDKCPNVFGLAKFDGCPDTDGDGTPDHLDECPDVKGLAKFNGCPDTDGDGIPDHLDKCPTVAGVKENNGCPAEETKPSVQIYKVVYFNTAQSSVITKYIKDLDEVAKIMNENADVKVSVAGHADSRGNDDFNMRLSEKRSDYVINYLVKKGVKKDRLIKSFFGESKPSSTIEGPEGWDKNRRVEIKSTL